MLDCKVLKKSSAVAQDLGLNVGALERGVDSAPFTCVRITGVQGKDETEYTAGDDSGLTIEAECSWGSQEIANSVLYKISGWSYRPYTASEALLEPAVELGDTVMINGWTSMVAKLERNFDKMLDENYTVYLRGDGWNKENMDMNFTIEIPVVVSRG